MLNFLFSLLLLLNENHILESLEDNAILVVRALIDE